MRKSSLARMNAAFAVVLGHGLSGLNNLAGRALRFDVNPQARRGAVPKFSSARQDRRNARSQEMRVVNGFPVMQTLPSGLRRTDAQVEERLGLIA